RRSRRSPKSGVIPTMPIAKCWRRCASSRRRCRRPSHKRRSSGDRGWGAKPHSRSALARSRWDGFSDAAEEAESRKMVERSETSGGIGKPVQRKEDGRLLTGKGVYVTDVWLPNTAYAWMVRSPHAHARIRAIDISAAMKSPGVIAVFTGKDLLADGLHLMDHKPSLVGPPDVAVTVRPGFDTFIHAQPML